MQPAPIALWHDAVRAGDLTPFEAVIAEDAVFYSPVVHSGQTGKALVAKYLRAAMQVLNNETFRYRDEWVGEGSAVLEFELELDGLYVNGVDMIRWNAEGRVVEFRVMIRPLKALNAVIPRMAEKLGA